MDVVCVYGHLCYTPEHTITPQMLLLATHDQQPKTLHPTQTSNQMAKTAFYFSLRPVKYYQDSQVNELLVLGLAFLYDVILIQDLTKSAVLCVCVRGEYVCVCVCMHVCVWCVSVCMVSMCMCGVHTWYMWAHVHVSVCVPEEEGRVNVQTNIKTRSVLVEY